MKAAKDFGRPPPAAGLVPALTLCPLQAKGHRFGNRPPSKVSMSVQPRGGLSPRMIQVTTAAGGNQAGGHSLGANITTARRPAPVVTRIDSGFSGPSTPQFPTSQLTTDSSMRPSGSITVNRMSFYPSSESAVLAPQLESGSFHGSKSHSMLNKRTGVMNRAPSFETISQHRVNSSHNGAQRTMLAHTGRPLITSSGGGSQHGKTALPADLVSRYYSDRTYPVSGSPPLHPGFEGFPPAPANADLAAVNYRVWKGAERVVSSEPRTLDEKIVLNEYVLEHEVKVPRRQVREDIFERTYVVPEKVVVEEMIESSERYLEKIIEYATPVIRERIVEVPEYELVERTVEVPQVITKEKIRHVPKIQIVERIVHVPQPVQQEKIVEVPVYEYRDVPVEKLVEYAEVQEQIVLKEVKIPQYIERPEMEEKIVEVEDERHRYQPIPVEAQTTVEFKLPKVRPVYNQIPVPVYVPRFIEVPVCSEYCNQTYLDEAEKCNRTVTTLLNQSAENPIDLTTMDVTAAMVQDGQFSELYEEQNIAENFLHWWNTNQLTIDELSIRSICKTVEPSGQVIVEAISSVEKTTRTATTAEREMSEGGQQKIASKLVSMIHGDEMLPQNLSHSFAAEQQVSEHTDPNIMDSQNIYSGDTGVSDIASRLDNSPTFFASQAACVEANPSYVADKSEPSVQIYHEEEHQELEIAEGYADDHDAYDDEDEENQISSPTYAVVARYDQEEESAYEIQVVSSSGGYMVADGTKVYDVYPEDERIDEHVDVQEDDGDDERDDEGVAADVAEEEEEVEEEIVVKLYPKVSAFSSARANDVLLSASHQARADSPTPHPSHSSRDSQRVNENVRELSSIEDFSGLMATNDHDDDEVDDVDDDDDNHRNDDDDDDDGEEREQYSYTGLESDEATSQKDDEHPGLDAA